MLHFEHNAKRASTYKSHFDEIGSGKWHFLIGAVNGAFELYFAPEDEDIEDERLKEYLRSNNSDIRHIVLWGRES